MMVLSILLALSFSGPAADTTDLGSALRASIDASWARSGLDASTTRIVIDVDAFQQHFEGLLQKNSAWSVRSLSASTKTFRARRNQIYECDPEVSRANCKPPKYGEVLVYPVMSNEFHGDTLTTQFNVEYRIARSNSLGYSGEARTYKATIHRIGEGWVFLGVQRTAPAGKVVVGKIGGRRQ